ncbi:MAG: hypothetical protein WC211_00590 [Dehalococcoidia bacterium]
MTARRVYRVTVEVTAYVLATSPEEAEEWCLGEGSYDLREEEPEAMATLDPVTAVDSGIAASLPWIACDVDDDERDRTVAEWLALARLSTTNAAKSGTPETFVHNIFLARAALVCADDDAAIRAVVRMAIVGSLPVVDAPASEAAQ